MLVASRTQKPIEISTVDITREGQGLERNAFRIYCGRSSTCIDDGKSSGKRVTSSATENDRSSKDNSWVNSIGAGLAPDPCDCDNTSRTNGREICCPSIS